eukprot:TRINITY_DN5459_c0_g1_i2.p1 TRINITY_DN5459_c0_g1~~TRINITY_DN5459_c0_g1_i2.p1  ORF type:complete len:666 (+),score=47.26 TRINITY_DN5459_c0_g1_i2:750-2747(+)
MCKGAVGSPVGFLPGVLVSLLVTACCGQEPVVVDVDVTDTSSVIGVDYKVPPMGCIQFYMGKQKMGYVMRFGNSKMVNFNGTVLFAQSQRVDPMGKKQCWIDQQTLTYALPTPMDCRNCKVLVEGQTYDNSCWASDDVALYYEIFNPSQVMGTYSFDGLDMVQASNPSVCISPYAQVPSPLNECSDVILPDCFAPGNGSGGMRLGYQDNSNNFPCTCYCHYGWSGPNCDNPPGCNSIDLTGATTCGGSPCDGIATPFQGVAGKESAFGGVDPFPTTVKEEDFNGSTVNGMVMDGGPCDPAYNLDTTVGYVCTAKGGAATVKGQICVLSPTAVPPPPTDAPATPSPPTSTTCDTIDLADPTTCGGAACEGLDASYSALIYNDGKFGDVAGNTPATEDIFVSGNVTGTGSLCDAMYMFNPTPPMLSCPAGDGLATTSGQLCVAATANPTPTPQGAVSTAAPMGVTSVPNGGGPATAAPSGTASPSSPPSDDKFILGLIIGMTVACVCCIWLIVFCYLRKRRELLDKELDAYVPVTHRETPPPPPPDPTPSPMAKPPPPPPKEPTPPPTPPESDPPTPPEEPLLKGRDIIPPEPSPAVATASPLAPPSSVGSSRNIRGSNTSGFPRTGSVRGRPNEYTPSSPVSPVPRRGSRSIASGSVADRRASYQY